MRSLLILKLKLLLFLLLSAYTCKPIFAQKTVFPLIKKGVSTITGSITSLNPQNGGKFVHVATLHPISNENVVYKTLLDTIGRFSIDIPLETNISFISISTDIDPYKSVLLQVENGVKTRVDIQYNSNNRIKVYTDNLRLTDYEILNGIEIIGNMIEYRLGSPESLYEKSPEYFLEYVDKIVNHKLTILENDTSFTKETKDILSKDFKMMLYNVHVFDYEDEMHLNYENTKPDSMSGKLKVKEIGRPYYHFLRKFDLSNPLYLYCYSFCDFQKNILRNDLIGLPEIGETNISEWVQKSKLLLSDLIGFDSGLYYDILAANAYAKQFEDKMQPLSDKQKENITEYWKNNEIAKILLSKNQEIESLYKYKESTKINDVSSIPAQEIENYILSQHKNKIILMDFWATWCAPCLEAIQMFRTTKVEFFGKDIVFVYLTNSSSPLKLWTEKIEGIGGEHYYLTSQQWEYLMTKYDLDYIPSYILYDKRGVLHNKHTSFPGNEEMSKTINLLLK